MLFNVSVCGRLRALLCIFQQICHTTMMRLRLKLSAWLHGPTLISVNSENWEEKFRSHHNHTPLPNGQNVKRKNLSPESWEKITASSNFQSLCVIKWDGLCGSSSGLFLVLVICDAAGTAATLLRFQMASHGNCTKSCMNNKAKALYTGWPDFFTFRLTEIICMPFTCFSHLR